jgi:hypothetical protein
MVFTGTNTLLRTTNNVLVYPFFITSVLPIDRIYMYNTTGAATSSSTLKGFILAMLHHGDVQRRIQNEVDLVIGHDRTPLLSDRAAMPYTEAAILETLRFGCIVPMGIPHATMEDVTFRGYSIAKGTTVSTNTTREIHVEYIHVTRLTHVICLKRI